MAVKHDWYQTEEIVVITVLLKDAAKRNCKVTIEADRLLLEAHDYNLELNLMWPINAEKSFFKFSSVKVEITLVKLVGKRWADLTKEDAENKPPSNNVFKRDWDALVAKIASEKDEDVQPLHALFGKADADVRRAVAKSMYESNGTVLNTDWKAVSAKKVETKPPEGTEFVQWD